MAIETREQIEAEIKRKKQEKLRLLRENEKYRRDNKIEFFRPPPEGYIPPTVTEEIRKLKDLYQNPKQIALFKAFRNPEYKKFTYTGANRTGKTTSLVCLGFSTMFGYYPWDEFQEPLPIQVPAKILMVGQIWGENIKKVLQPKMEDWWPKNRVVETSRKDGVKNWWRDKKTGSTLDVLSNQQDRNAFESADWDFILWDEPPEYDNWLAATRGLIDRGGREFFANTLIEEQVWFYREILKRRKKDGTPDRKIFNIHATMRDNVGYGLALEDVEEYEDRLPENQRQARIYGIPAFLAGLIFPTFKRDIHLKSRFRAGVPIDWLIDIAIDVHPKEPQAVLFVATSPKGYKYVVEEIYENGGGKWLGQEIIKSIKRNCYRVNKIIIDPAAKGDENAPEGSTYDQIERVLAQYDGPEFPQGYALDLGSKDLKSGILLVKDWLITENEEPGLFFFDDLVRTVWELEGWMWNPKTGKPVDKDDHMCENLRRLLQLETVWYPPDDEDEDSVEESDKGRSSVTGY